MAHRKIPWKKNKTIKKTPHRTSKNRAFPAFGNLAAQFFNETDVEGRPFLFYFDYLTDYYDKRSPEYNSYAKQVGEKAKQSLSANNYMLSTSKDNNRALEQYGQLLKILEGSIAYERKNEEEYFKQKIDTIKSNFTEEELQMVTELKEVLDSFDTDSDSAFPYDELITLINILYQGLDYTRTVFSYEAERIQKINAVMYNAHKNYTNSLMGYAKKKKITEEKYEEFLDRNQSRRRKRIETHYLSRKQVHNFSGLKEIQELNRTATVEIARWLTKTINEAYEDQKTRKQVVELLSENFMDGEKTNVTEAQIKTALIKTYTTYTAEHMNEILNQIYNNKTEKILFDAVKDSMGKAMSFKIDGFYDNFGQFGRKRNYFKNLEDNEEELQRSAEGLYDALEDFYKRAKSQKKQGLNEDEQALWDFVGVNRKNDKFGPTISLIHDLEHISKDIQERIKYLKKVGQTTTETMDAILRENKNSANFDRNLGSIEIEYKNGEWVPKIGNLIAQIKNSKGMEVFTDKRMRADTLEGAIAGLKTRVSNLLANQLDEVRKQVVNDSKEGVKKTLLDSYQAALENMRISIGGAALEEIMQGIQESLVEQFEAGLSGKSWTGKQNRKNDFVTVTTATPVDKGYILKQTQQVMDDVSQTAVNSINALREQAKLDVQQFGIEFQNEINKLDGYNNVSRNADLFLNRKSSKKADIIIDKILKQDGEEAGSLQQVENDLTNADEQTKKRLERKKEFLNQLKDSFFESSTMKTYNEYQNDIGFVGGSIGSNLLSQLDTFYQLFREAGVPVTEKDFKWLARAIINCSPDSVVGDGNRDLIENYLGTLAAFSLFDEGGAELAIINEITNHTKTNYVNTTPKILHLYKVNSIYYPGSFVLTQVHEQIMKCYDALLKGEQIATRSKGVRITNRINKGQLPNKNGKIDENDPWGSIGQNAAFSDNKISIHVVFLAGIMDVLNRIKENIQAIDLP